MARDDSTLPLPFAHPAPRRLWREAVARWMRAGVAKSPRTAETERVLCAWLTERLDLRPLDEITDQVVEDLVDQLLADGRRPSTVNRFLGVLRAVLNSAVAWRWISYAPRIRAMREPPRRVRWLTPAEATRLMQCLPVHLVDVVGFSLETGLRKSNVTGLTWSQVDLEARLAWIHADQAKGRQPIGVPLSGKAVEILQRLQGNHPHYVFTYRGRPIRQVNTKAWRAALRRAGIEGFRWHDLRHTWASWHAQAGTPLHVLQELGAWRSPRMVQVYAHLSTAHLRSYVEKTSLYVEERSRKALKNPPIGGSE